MPGRVDGLRPVGAGGGGAATGAVATGAGGAADATGGRGATGGAAATGVFPVFFALDFVDELVANAALVGGATARAADPERAVRFMGSCRAGEPVRYHLGRPGVNDRPLFAEQSRGSYDICNRSARGVSNASRERDRV